MARQYLGVTLQQRAAQQRAAAVVNIVARFGSRLLSLGGGPTPRGLEFSFPPATLTILKGKVRRKRVIVELSSMLPAKIKKFARFCTSVVPMRDGTIKSTGPEAGKPRYMPFGYSGVHSRDE